MDERLNDIILKLLGLLDQMVEERGVPKDDTVNKNIIKSDKSTFDTGDRGRVRAMLSPSEKEKLKKVFTLFNQMFFTYQEKVQKDVSEKKSVEGLVTKISQTQRKTTAPPKEEKKGMGLMSMILAGLALLGTSILGIIGGISGIFGKWGGAAIAGGKLAGLGLLGMLRMIGGVIAKRFAKGVLKKLPVIGGIISLAYAVMAFKDGNIFLGIAELISGLLNFVPVVGPFLSLGADILIAWAEGKGMFEKGGALSPENGWTTIKGWASKLWDFIWDHALYMPILGAFKRFGMAKEEFNSGNVSEGLLQVGYGLMTFMGGGWLVWGIETFLGWLGSSDKKDQKVEKDSSIISDWVSKIGSFIWDHALYLPVLGGIKRFGMAKDAFSSGDFVEGIKQIGYAAMTFGGGGWLVAGIETLLGWFSSSDKKEDKITPDSSWMSKMNAWIREKLNVLPDWLKAPLKWFGILEDDEKGKPAIAPQEQKVPWTKRLREWLKEKMDSLPGPIKTALGWFGIGSDIAGEAWEGAKSLYSKAASKVSSAWDSTVKSAKDFGEGMMASAKGLAGMATGFMKDAKEKSKSTLKKASGDISGEVENLGTTIGDGISGITDGVKNVLKPSKDKEGGSFLGMMFDAVKEETGKLSKGNMFAKIMPGLFGDSKSGILGDAEAASPKGGAAGVSGDASEEPDEKRTITIGNLYESSEKQVKLLANLVNLTTQSLMELKRMAGGSGGSVITSPNINISGQSGNGKSMNVQGNRPGYLSSAYSLG